MTKNDTMTGIERAIEAAGGQVLLAEALGVTQQAVSKMKTDGYCSMGRALRIKELFQIDLRDLLDPKFVAIFDEDR